MIRLPHSCTQKSAAGSVAEQAVVAAREMEHGSWLRIEPRRSRDESRRLTNAFEPPSACSVCSRHCPSVAHAYACSELERTKQYYNHCE